MAEHTCPYCGQGCDGITAVKGEVGDLFRSRGVPLTPMELNVLAALAYRPIPVSYDGLVDFLYGDSIDGGPLTAYNCTKLVISRCRKKIALAKLNWSIETIYGQGHVLHRPAPTTKETASH